MKILGVDLGVASVGWALVDDENNEIIDSGVRIFTQSINKDGKTLAAVRREFRGSRRALSRKKQRLIQLKKLFISNKLLSKSEFMHLFNSEKRLDIWQLRAKGLERQLDNKEWARVLYHIAKRRAYQSNRKAEESGNTDKKKVLSAIKTNQEKMEQGGYQTIGEMIYSETKHPSSGRVRRNKKDNYTWSVSRIFLRKEIDVLFEKQAELGNQFTTDELKQKYKQIVFTQRPIQFKADLVGKCTFEQDKYRGAKNCFSAEKSVLLNKINNTDLIDENTGEIKRLFEFSALDKLLDIFYKTKEVKYATLRKQLEISGNFEFKQLDYHQNFEYKTNIKAKIVDFYKLEDWLTPEQKEKLEKQVLDDKKEKFKRYKYSSIRSILSLQDSQKFKGVKYDTKVEDTVFGKLNGYHSIKKELNQKVFDLLFTKKIKFNKIAEIITYQKDDESATQDLKEQVFKNLDLDEIAINEAIDGLLNISFSGFNNLSVQALDKIIPHQEEGLKYHNAIKEVYEHHSHFKNTNPQQYLRPLNKKENYQITNPTIKRVFSQFRKVLNAVIRKHGSFDVMHIEMARELKNSKKRKFEIVTGQKEYQQEKAEIKAQFLENFHHEGTGRELLKFRLYEQQHGKCIYSRQAIEIDRLLEDGYVEIDHILPWSRTFDNSLNNKVLCLKVENQNKADQTPFEYLANGEKNNSEWQEYKNYINSFVNIKQAKRNKLLNTNLPKRRGNDLTDNDIENPESGFLARNLNDTAYASKFIKNFVERNLAFLENSEIKQKVKTRNGALTSQLRYNWGVKEKNRGNNLHHAEDAIILAFSTQGEVQRMSTISANREDFKYQTTDERLVKFTPPFVNFKNALDQSINDIFVSFAPRRKVAGAAHKATIKSKNIGGKYKFSVNQGVAENGVIQRVDVFKNAKNKYQFVVFYPADFYKDDFPKLDLSGKEIDEDSKFLFSLFKDDLIEFKTKGNKKNPSRHLSAYFKYIQSDGRIAYQRHDKTEIERKKSDNKKGFIDILLATKSDLQSIKKYQVSILGDCQEVINEKRLPLIKQMRKNKSKQQK
ncbi:type II CRISPR RNA-guided endonuclease Cas9 [bacterium endosymbiont of Bathymodiolus sp. 5 South]|uniref:type II CRISPR RNA-guided endonuclease Cas9 n=1 Tax=bacterium endosymbiont of Bathymodiolus sp. 5 South TaxID=1181670 RepID=UPI0010B845F3|nr:type II CRISPR RNA-guided endonuclease Cas9 [bacterium endosymbiont of Bathymodiolus sp. 5 South]SSC07859.1 CRISPR-associated protein, Csn1 family [bacterium endosymbiont of Bathymodiolus sp. 5 South]